MDDRPKQITGYCEPLSLRAGDHISLKASSHSPGPATLDIVRISCGDRTRYGPGFSETEIDSSLPDRVDLSEAALIPGSFASVDLKGLTAAQTLQLEFALMATRPSESQPVVVLEGTTGTVVEIALDSGHLIARSSVAELRLRSRPIAGRRWYRIELDVDLETGAITALATTAPTVSPGRDLLEVDPEPTIGDGSTGPVDLQTMLLAASPSGGRFDGRISSPRLGVDGLELSWDFSSDIGDRTIADLGGVDRPLELHQLPARAVTGPAWNGTVHRWCDEPTHYDAIHFHSDDLYDAGWQETASLDLPADLASGIYAFRLRGDAGDDRIPFFVRPAIGAPTADIALLMPSCTYMAYANHRMLFEGTDFVESRTRLRPEHEYVRDHPELDLSTYEKHSDGSGVMFSSRRRPVLQLRPGADGWNFTPDTVINAFLDHLAVGHDIVTDEDLHAEGVDALAPDRVIVSGSHPEYWSTVMLDGLEQWQRGGGRLIYAGGNGFYWRVAFSDSWPGAIELRRAEDGVRNWQCEPGESYHAFGGEYGGLWRRLGRAPNELVGIGFAAQGFDRASYYERTEASYTSRAAWIFDGVHGERIGTSGLGGGAAGQEVDRYDTRLGSPEHAIVLASATDFGPDMIRTKEEFEAAVTFPTPDPYVRADMTFFETPNGGAVFSVGSISWFGALARDGWDNDIAQITTNVVRRFLDQAPFELP